MFRFLGLQHLKKSRHNPNANPNTNTKKARKAAKKLLKGGATEEIEEQEKDSSTKKLTGKGKKRQEEEREAASKAELELLLSDDDEGYDMRALQKEEKDRLKGPKGKRKRFVIMEFVIIIILYQNKNSNIFTFLNL
jgi:hypothetical protein